MTRPAFPRAMLWFWQKTQRRLHPEKKTVPEPEPFILDLYLVYFCLPAIIRGLGINPDGWPLTVYVLVSLTFHYAPVISEILRPAYLSVDRGQHEAAIVFGLSPVRRVFSIIAPQCGDGFCFRDFTYRLS